MPAKKAKHRVAAATAAAAKPAANAPAASAAVTAAAAPAAASASASSASAAAPSTAASTASTAAAAPGASSATAAPAVPAEPGPSSAAGGAGGGGKGRGSGSASSSASSQSQAQVASAPPPHGVAAASSNAALPAAAPALSVADSERERVRQQSAKQATQIAFMAHAAARKIAASDPAVAAASAVAPAAASSTSSAAPSSAATATAAPAAAPAASAASSASAAPATATSTGSSSQAAVVPAVPVANAAGAVTGVAVPLTGQAMRDAASAASAAGALTPNKHERLDMKAVVDAVNEAAKLHSTTATTAASSSAGAVAHGNGSGSGAMTPMDLLALGIANYTSKLSPTAAADPLLRAEINALIANTETLYRFVTGAGAAAAAASSVSAAAPAAQPTATPASTATGTAQAHTTAAAAPAPVSQALRNEMARTGLSRLTQYAPAAPHRHPSAASASAVATPAATAAAGTVGAAPALDTPAEKALAKTFAKDLRHARQHMSRFDYAAAAVIFEKLAAYADRVGLPATARREDVVYHTIEHAALYEAWSAALSGCGQADSSIDKALRALELLAMEFGPNSLQLRGLLLNLQHAYLLGGRLAEAREVQVKLAQLHTDPDLPPHEWAFHPRLHVTPVPPVVRQLQYQVTGLTLALETGNTKALEQADSLRETLCDADLQHAPVPFALRLAVFTKTAAALLARKHASEAAALASSVLAELKKLEPGSGATGVTAAARAEYEALKPFEPAATQLLVAQCYAAARDFELALRHYRDAVQSLASHPAVRDHAQHAQGAIGLAECYRELRNYELALREYDKAELIAMRAWGADHASVGALFESRAKLHWLRKELALTVSALENAFKIYSALHIPVFSVCYAWSVVDVELAAATAAAASPSPAAAVGAAGVASGLSATASAIASVVSKPAAVPLAVAIMDRARRLARLAIASFRAAHPDVSVSTAEWAQGTAAAAAAVAVADSASKNGGAGANGAPATTTDIAAVAAAAVAAAGNSNEPAPLKGLKNTLVHLMIHAYTLQPTINAAGSANGAVVNPFMSYTLSDLIGGAGGGIDAVRRCANLPACGRRQYQSRVPFQRCGGCRVVYYCGSVCQHEHWTNGGHRAQCRPLFSGYLASPPPPTAAALPPQSPATMAKRPVHAAAAAAGAAGAGERKGMSPAIKRQAQGVATTGKSKSPAPLFHSSVNAGNGWESIANGTAAGAVGAAADVEAGDDAHDSLATTSAADAKAVAALGGADADADDDGDSDSPVTTPPAAKQNGVAPAKAANASKANGKASKLVAGGRNGNGIDAADAEDDDTLYDADEERVPTATVAAPTKKRSPADAAADLEAAVFSDIAAVRAAANK